MENADALEMGKINSTNLNVGNALSVLCKKKNISVAQLSRSVKVPASTINSIISGKIKNPGIVTINKLCQAFEISLAEFFEIAENGQK